MTVVLPGQKIYVGATPAGALYKEDEQAWPYTSLFDPTTITGCVGWWDASQLGLVNNASVTTWPDLSSSGRHLTGKTTGRPVYKTNVLNGLGVVNYQPDTVRTLHYNAAVTFRHVFAVARYRVGTFANYDGLIGGAGGNDLLFVGTGGAANFYNHWGGDITYYYNGALTTPSLTAPVNNTWQQFNISRNSGPWLFTTFQVGQDRGETNRLWDGDVAELIAYNRILTTVERQTVEDALREKWGL